MRNSVLTDRRWMMLKRIINTIKKVAAVQITDLNSFQNNTKGLHVSTFLLFNMILAYPRACIYYGEGA